MHAGSARELAGHQHCVPPTRGLGHLGPHPHLRGALRRRQHLLLTQARLHFLSQPLPRPPAGGWAVTVVNTAAVCIFVWSGLPQQNGDRHHQVHIPLPPRPLRILLR